MTLRTGDRVPDFQTTVVDGAGGAAPFRLADVLGKGPVVFFFYPKDETAGCTAEACAFRDANADFAAAGAVVFGVSSDDVASHQGFIAHHKLPYGLIADVDGNLRDRVFGVPRDFLGMSAGRATYVLDRTGVVRHVHRGVLSMQGHIDAALQMIQKLKSPSASASVSLEST